MIAAPQMDAGFVAHGADAGSDAGADAGIVTTPHLNQAEKVWLAQEDVWLTGTKIRTGDCTAALSWLIAIKRGTGAVQNGTYTELASGDAAFSPGGNTIKVRNVAGWSGELRVDALVGDVAMAGFPHGSDFVDVSWLWNDGTTGRCQLREKSDHIVGRFFIDAERFDVDFSSTTESEVSSSYNPQTYSTVVLVLGHGEVTGTLTTLTGDRSVTVHTASDWSSCSGSPCYTAALWYEHQHSVSLRLGNVAWSLDYKTGYTVQTAAAVQQKLWRGTIAGPTAGALVVTPIGPAFTLDVVIGADRYTADTASQLQ